MQPIPERAVLWWEVVACRPCIPVEGGTSSSGTPLPPPQTPPAAHNNNRWLIHAANICHLLLPKQTRRNYISRGDFTGCPRSVFISLNLTLLSAVSAIVIPRITIGLLVMLFKTKLSVTLKPLRNQIPPTAVSSILPKF